MFDEIFERERHREVLGGADGGFEERLHGSCGQQVSYVHVYLCVYMLTLICIYVQSPPPWYNPNSTPNCNAQLPTK